jgi:hypothetical protein
MSISTEAIIAIVSLSLSVVSVTICGFLACKNTEKKKKIIDSHIVKVNSIKEMKALDLLNELDVVKQELHIIKENNLQLTNKMTKTVQKILGEEWVSYFDENHQAYYWYNKQTGETTWVNPVDII